MIDVAVPVESSAPAPEAVADNFDPATFTHDEYSAYMEKGTIPKAKADPPPAKPAVPSESTAESQQEHKGKDRTAEGRIRELLAENKALKEAQQAKKDVPAEPSTAPKAEKPKAPKFGDVEGDTWEQLEARQEVYVGELVKYQLAAEREANEKQRRDAETATENKRIEDAWKSKLETAKSNHSDFAEVAFSKDLPISPVMDGFILDSEVGAEILYHLGSHVDEGKAIAAMPPYRATRALIKIEASLSGEATPEQKPVVAPITKAAKPAPDLRAVNAAPVNELRAAIEADDITRFNEIQDRKLLERRKKG